jgi:hypothetical protein
MSNDKLNIQAPENPAEYREEAKKSLNPETATVEALLYVGDQIAQQNLILGVVANKLDTANTTMESILNRLQHMG